MDCNASRRPNCGSSTVGGLVLTLVLDGAGNWKAFAAKTEVPRRVSPRIAVSLEVCVRQELDFV